MSNEIEIEQFAEMAVKRYGDKIVFSAMTISEEVWRAFLKAGWTEKMLKEFSEYRQVWVRGDKCPECGEDLFRLFGTFEWGLVHGYGYCTTCKENGKYVGFKYYHYFEDGEKHEFFRGMALAGFPEEQDFPTPEKRSDHER